MWLKKSDIFLAEPRMPLSGTGGWRQTLTSNFPLPLALIAVLLLGLFVESPAFGAYYQRMVMLIGFNIILAVSLQLINGFSGQFSLGHAGFMAVGAYMAAYPAQNLSHHLQDPGASAWFFISLAMLVGVVGSALLLLFRGFRATKVLHPALPVALLIGLLAWVLIDLARAAKYDQTPDRFIWTNLFALVVRVFDAVLTHGVPVGSSLSSHLPVVLRQPLCFLVMILGGGSCAAVMGLIVGMPALRLRGDYLAIATLGMAEIIRILIQNSQPLGGALGLVGIPKHTNFAWLYVFVVITIVVIWRVAYSAKGRAIMAVREDEVAAAAIGIDTTHHKVMAFIIGSFFGGVAGALFALHERSIAPYQFGLAKSIEIVVMVTLGGLGSISGAILAAVVLTLLPELLRPVADYRMIIYSLLLILMMLLRPQGLLGGRELWWRRRTADGPRGFEPVPTEDRDDIGEQLE